MRDSPISYDERLRAELQALLERVDHLLVDINVQCPYGLPHVATFHQATFAPLNDRAMELFLSGGFRRNGNCLYSMKCKTCNGCLPVRLHADTFKANRNQRRSVKRNRDVETELMPLHPRLEDLELCGKFLADRYPQENNNAEGYYREFFLNNIVSSAQIQFRVDGRLVGNSIIDIGYNWLNAVYFYFDPDEGRRSLGTFNIMTLIELCREWKIQYLYLGYLIDEVAAMSYKRNFRPHYVYHAGYWYESLKDETHS